MYLICTCIIYCKILALGCIHLRHLDEVLKKIYFLIFSWNFAWRHLLMELAINRQFLFVQSGLIWFCQHQIGNFWAVSTDLLQQMIFPWLGYLLRIWSIGIKKFLFKMPSIDEAYHKIGQENLWYLVDFFMYLVICPKRSRQRFPGPPSICFCRFKNLLLCHDEDGSKNVLYPKNSGLIFTLNSNIISNLLQDRNGDCVPFFLLLQIAFGNL